METNKEYKLVPDFGYCLGTGWKVMMDNFLRLFLVIIILAIVVTPFKIFNFHFNPSDIWRGPWNWNHGWGHHMFNGSWNEGREWGQNLFRVGTFGIFAAFFGLLAVLYSFLVKPVFEYGGNFIFVQAVRKVKPDFEYLIKGFMENYLRIILANLLVFA
jgi:hypothetical protein